MKRLLRLPKLLSLISAFLMALVFQSCTQENMIKLTTDDTPNMTSYLKANPDYSMFLEILNITNYASFMNTYGTYTMFIPTNDAVKQYLIDVGATSLSQIPLVDLQNLAKFHILEKEIYTTDFTDGKIQIPTMQGLYLITGAANNNGVSRATVNKTSNVLASNIELGNGVVHIIDRVLRVPNKTLAQTIEENENLSLFTEVLKATGWYDKLNQPITYDSNNIGSYLTVLVQTNQVFSEAGFDTLDDLKAKYAPSGDPLDPNNGLNLYVQYHVLPNLNYLADLVKDPVFVTKAPLEVVSTELVREDLFINRAVFNGVLEEGVGVIRADSDISCSNGVFHNIDKNLEIIKRPPMPVYFDLCNQPEFAANVSNYRKPTGIAFGYGAAGFSEITWTGVQTYNVSWQPQPLAWNGDQLSIFRLRPSNGLQNVTFTTPVLIKGRYKVWVSYRQNGSASTEVKAYFNDEQLSRTINLRERAISPTTTPSDKVLESLGYKRYIYPYTSNSVYSRLVGIIEVPTTGRHKFKLHSDIDGGEAWFDIVEFRPVDMDQIWPKFKAGLAGEGGLVNREDAPTDN